MIQEKVVAHYLDGQIFKGSTKDFFPSQDRFHLTLVDDLNHHNVLELNTSGLKGLFFVKDFDGNRQYDEKKDFDSSRPAVGHKIKIKFKDGEVMIGTTNGYQKDLPGFIFIPADPDSNNESCFIVKSATKQISLI